MTIVSRLMTKRLNIKCKNNKEGVPSYALNHLDGLEKHPFYQKRRSIKIEYKIQQTHFFKPFMMHTK